MDDPRICILVLLDNPDAGCGTYVSGGNMGAPTVGNMMADILPYLGIEPNYTAEELEFMDRSVPNMMGMEVEAAQHLLESQGLTYRVIGHGPHVTMQLPAGNSVVAAKSQIVLFADGAVSEELEEVPDLTGLTYDIARQRLGYLALFINTNCHAISDSQTMVVSQQSVAPGEMVEHGTVLEVTLVDTDTKMYGHY